MTSSRNRLKAAPETAYDASPTGRGNANSPHPVAANVSHLEPGSPSTPKDPRASSTVFVRSGAGSPDSKPDVKEAVSARGTAATAPGEPTAEAIAHSATIG
ncbi:hypothetical protein ACVNF4_04090 [Streptomyces sp. S6]